MKAERSVDDERLHSASVPPSAVSMQRFGHTQRGRAVAGVIQRHDRPDPSALELHQHTAVEADLLRVTAGRELRPVQGEAVVLRPRDPQQEEVPLDEQEVGALRRPRVEQDARHGRENAVARQVPAVQLRIDELRRERTQMHLENMKRN